MGYISAYCQTGKLPERKFYFNHVGVAQGLPNGFVNAVFRDHLGMLWIGTYNGLACFDGAHFKFWKVDIKNPKSIENSVVQGITEDANGNIWCSTEKGVSRFDHKEFFNYHLFDQETGEMSVIYNWAVQRTPADEIVACGTGGLFFYDAKADSFVQAIPKGPDGNRLFRGVHKNSMAIDSVRNGIWLGTDRGVAYFDLKTRQYVGALHNPKNWKALSGNVAHPVVLDRQGRLFYHDEFLEAFVTWNPETNDSTARSTAKWTDRKQTFTTSYIDPLGNIWISSWHPNAYFWEAATGKVYQFAHNSGDQYTIASNFFWDVHRDADGTMYFGTANGLSIVNPQSTFFSILELPDTIDHRSNYGTPLLLNVDLQDRLWLAPSYDFLLSYDLKSEKFRRFDLFGVPNPRDPDRKRVASMTPTKDTLYFGTTDGIYTLDLQTDRFAKLPFLPPSLGLEGHFILEIMLNRHHEIWADVSQKGLLRYNIKTHAAQIYPHDPNDSTSFSNRGAYQIYEDEKGEMWFNCADEGIVRFDRAHDRFEYLPKSVQTKIGSCKTFYINRHGNLWILNTFNELFHYDIQSKKLTRDFPTVELDHLSYGDMLFDKDQRLWLTIHNDFAIVDGKKGTVTKFSINHSPDDSRWAHSLYSLRDGRILSESRNALIFFDPDVRKQSVLIDPVLISHFSAIDTTITFLDDLETIHLGYWQNYFSLDFGSIGLLKSGERQWQYRLEGFDPIWIDCGERRTAYYTNVPSGEYTFQVRVKDGTGQWHPSSHPIKINIGRIFYRTFWFKSLLILFIIAIVLWWMNTWTQRARNREYERAISYFANSMHGSNQVQDILRDITDNVITRTNLVDCVIYLVDESGQALIKVAAYGENNAEEHDGINPLSIPIGSGIVGKVAASQQAMVIADTRNEPEYIPSLLQGRSEIAVPIVHDGRVLGVIDAEHPRRNFFKKAHLDLLTTIASISSSKIANAQKATEIEENERRLKELQSMVSETRQLALRAQMNPHFIFNCLNSINSFILDNDQETASRYLIKFAKLIRLILENSNSKLIPLQSELDALKLYIEMEALRFEPKFSWQIDVDEEVAAHHVMVPPLILQPFVENAIWHGLLHKSGPGNLTVAVTQPENTLTCTITDNGVGREASRQNKAASLNQKQSLGLKLTQERLALMHEQEQKKFKVEIFDLHDKEGNALGTQVVIEMELND